MDPPSDPPAPPVEPPHQLPTPPDAPRAIADLDDGHMDGDAGAPARAAGGDAGGGDGEEPDAPGTPGSKPSPSANASSAPAPKAPRGGGGGADDLGPFVDLKSVGIFLFVLGLCILITLVVVAVVVAKVMSSKPRPMRIQESYFSDVDMYWDELAQPLDMSAPPPERRGYTSPRGGYTPSYESFM